MELSSQAVVRVHQVHRKHREARGRTIFHTPVEVYIDLKWCADSFDDADMQVGAVLGGLLVHGARGPELREYVSAPTEFMRASVAAT